LQKLWVEFLRAKSHDLSTRDPPTATTSGSETASGEEWDRLCARAMGLQPSYAVAFEVSLPVMTAYCRSKGKPCSLQCRALIQVAGFEIY